MYVVTCGYVDSYYPQYCQERRGKMTVTVLQRDLFKTSNQNSATATNKCINFIKQIRLEITISHG